MSLTYDGFVRASVAIVTVTCSSADVGVITTPCNNFKVTNDINDMLLYFWLIVRGYQRKYVWFVGLLRFENDEEKR